MRHLRAYGLYRDEHEDFKEEMERLRYKRNSCVHLFRSVYGKDVPSILQDPPRKADQEMESAGKEIRRPKIEILPFVSALSMFDAGTEENTVRLIGTKESPGSSEDSALLWLRFCTVQDAESVRAPELVNFGEFAKSEICS